MPFKKIIFSFNKTFKNKNKEKRKFLIAGLLNVFITNFFLQSFLFFNLFNISISAFLSQLINMVFGYSVYGKFIFKVKNVRNISFIKKYFALMIFIWLVNTLGIELGTMVDISKNLSAFLMMPILAITSYLLQKFWVFRQI